MAKLPEITNYVKSLDVIYQAQKTLFEKQLSLKYFWF